MKYSELLHFFEFKSFWKMTSTVYVPLWVNCLNRSCLMPWRPIRRSTTSPLRSAKNLNLNEIEKKIFKRLIKKSFLTSWQTSRIIRAINRNFVNKAVSRNLVKFFFRKNRLGWVTKISKWSERHENFFIG